MDASAAHFQQERAQVPPKAPETLSRLDARNGSGARIAALEPGAGSARDALKAGITDA
jgi:hypothetical protein